MHTTDVDAETRMDGSGTHGSGRRTLVDALSSKIGRKTSFQTGNSSGNTDDTRQRDAPVLGLDVQSVYLDHDAPGLGGEDGASMLIHRVSSTD